MSLPGNILGAGVAVLLLHVTSTRCAAGSPPGPPRAASFGELQVTVRNARDGTTLAGTLAIPAAPRPTAAVVLVPAGSLDRDATAGRHRPFQALAAHLARHGVISLRADSRGIGGSGGKPWPAVTKRELASDVEAAIAFLKRRLGARATRIGLIGHSEGASVAVMVAGRSPEVAFVVMLAGPGVPGSRGLGSQVRSVGAAFGVERSTLERFVQLLEETAAVLREHPGEGDARTELARLYDEYLRRTTSAERSSLTRIGFGAPESAREFAAGVLLPWMRDFLLYDPRPDLRRVRCPVLSLIGDKDLQVAAGENGDAIREALERGGNRHAEVVALAGLNHLLQVARTGSPAEYQDLGDAIAPAALEAVSSWVSAQR